MKVLVIDDNEADLEHTARVLRDAGFTVLTLTSPLGAAASVGGERPDLVLIDTEMPALPGEKVAAILKRQRHLTARVCLFAGNEPAPEMDEIVKRCGADGWLRKTTNATALVASVKLQLDAAPGTPPVPTTPAS